MSFGRIQMVVENENDGENKNKNGGTDELWVEDEIDFRWIGLGW